MIQPTSNYLGFNRADALANAAAKNASADQSPTSSGDRLSSSSSDALKQALNNSPEIRPDVVARGNHLAVDLYYPPRELIQRLAKMITDSVDLSEKA
ncbi:hypothetical protein DB347_16485 [Opitutaceae bacterium EW11]|nr:hypothetical protein DB347_16485 [Opitutaceae bacterium EW11]